MNNIWIKFNQVYAFQCVSSENIKKIVSQVLLLKPTPDGIHAAN